MSKLRNLIEAEAKQMRELHGAIHAAYQVRKQSRGAMEAWWQACDRYRRHTSPMEGRLGQIDTSGLAHSASLRDFAITFLEADPMYFRSGYIKAGLLHRLKSAEFDEREAARLAAVLVDAIRRRGQREFLYYCRLAAALRHPEVMAEAARLTDSADGRVASRARMMLRYLRGEHRR
jgi:hypothetical protein